MGRELADNITMTIRQKVEAINNQSGLVPGDEDYVDPESISVWTYAIYYPYYEQYITLGWQALIRLVICFIPGIRAYRSIRVISSVLIHIHPAWIRCHFWPDRSGHSWADRYRHLWLLRSLGCRHECAHAYNYGLKVFITLLSIFKLYL